VFSEAGEDSGDLRGSLAFAEDDFRHSISQGAVMVDFGETEIFKRQMPETRDGIVRRKFALAYLLE
jgi:hypothetical protein